MKRPQSSSKLRTASIHYIRTDISSQSGDTECSKYVVRSDKQNDVTRSRGLRRLTFAIAWALDDGQPKVKVERPKLMSSTLAGPTKPDGTPLYPQGHPALQSLRTPPKPAVKGSRLQSIRSGKVPQFSDTAQAAYDANEEPAGKFQTLD